MRDYTKLAVQDEQISGKKNMATLVIETSASRERSRAGRYVMLNFLVNTLPAALQRVVDATTTKFLNMPEQYDIPEGNVQQFGAKQRSVAAYVDAKFEAEQAALLRTAVHNIRKRHVTKVDSELSKEIRAVIRHNFDAARQKVVEAWQIRAIGLHLSRLVEHDKAPMQTLRKEPEPVYHMFEHEDAIRFAVVLHKHYKPLLDDSSLKASVLYYPILAMLAARHTLTNTDMTVRLIEYMTRRFVVFETLQQHQQHQQDAALVASWSETQRKTLPFSAVDMVRAKGIPYPSSQMFQIATEHSIYQRLQGLFRLHAAYKHFLLIDSSNEQMRRLLHRQLLILAQALPGKRAMRWFVTRLVVFMRAETNDYYERIGFDLTVGTDIETACAVLNDMMQTYEVLEPVLVMPAKRDCVIVKALSQCVGEIREKKENEEKLSLKKPSCSDPVMVQPRSAYVQ